MFPFGPATSPLPSDVEARDPFPYQSRVLELPALVAQAAFDAVRHNHARTDRHHWDVHVPSGRLELTGRGRLLPPPRACYWSYREVPGSIRATHWPLVIPVRLELLPWSDTATALGLGVRRLPVLTGDAQYLHVASQALDLLSTELHAWALTELHDLEQWLRTQTGLQATD